MFSSSSAIGGIEIGQSRAAGERQFSLGEISSDPTRGPVNARTFDPRDDLALALSGRRTPVGLGAPKVGGKPGRHVRSFGVTAVVSPRRGSCDSSREMTPSLFQAPIPVMKH